MDLLSLVLVAFGLAMDCLAVSVATGLTVRCHRLRCALRLGTTFGGFQAGMYLLGWLFGRSLQDVVGPFDHWIALGLLGFIGGKMIWDALHDTDEPGSDAPPTWRRTLVLGVATSVDALAVGLSLSLLGASLLLSASVIGAFSFGLSVAGVLAGARLGESFGRRAEIAGGLLLCGIGIHTVIGHLVDRI